MTAGFRFCAMSNQPGCCANYAAACTSAPIGFVLDTVILAVSILLWAVLV